MQMQKGKSKKSQKQQQQETKPTINVSNSNQSRWIWFALALVLVAIFTVYSRALRFDFVDWDDTAYIVNNEDIKKLSWDNLKLFFTKFYVGNYQPVTILSYAVEYKFVKYSASLYHFNNILLHALNTCLVFVLIRKISPRNAVVALITAAFFAVHPMHVESVAWVAERKDMLYSFFLLLALIMYTDYIRLKQSKYLIYSALFFVLSCMCKSAAVIFPVLMLLIDYYSIVDYYSNRKYMWKMILQKIPFFAISVVFGIVAINSQKSAASENAFYLSEIGRAHV